ncbi:DegV family protein [Clostridium sp. Marseille-P299]|uniref:DegV family protein n=1 Tax=Clostridium sp. Marseille-P299 TaxID=1805477 RepID=UPI00082F7BD3|nr:DegV family protein [Clostridium sp. Marseille-P299]
MQYQIISDSSCDLDKLYAKENNLEIVPFYVSFDSVNYKKEGIEVDHEEFYRRMIEEHIYPKTSLPSIEDYLNVFKKYSEADIPVICICISSKLSGSYQSAINAKNIIEESNPKAKITVIDSKLATVLQGIYVKEALRMQKDGKSYNECIENLERIRPSGRILFTIEDMDYLKKGGRIGKLLTFASDALKIRPLILFQEGEIFPAGICRSRKKAKLKLLDLAKDHFAKSGENINDYEIVVGTGVDYEEAEEFKKELELALNKDITLPVGHIGVTIGTHTGPHPFGLGLIKKYDA